MTKAHDRAPEKGIGHGMIFFPAIDLKDGQCVRLLHGDMDKATVFSDDPGAQAESFEQSGSQWLHIVDLNGAFEGEPVNAAAVRRILAAVSIPLQLGGGIRDMSTIETWLDAGVARVILGTVAVRDPDLVRRACRAHPGRVALGIDARDVEPITLLSRFALEMLRPVTQPSMLSTVPVEPV